MTSRQIKARLDREILGNVSIEVYPTTSGDTFEVRGRGELQLAVLIEQMRREGYELTASRPEVILRETADGLQEPYERITVDIPPDYIGEVQAALAGRKGRLEQMTTDADGRVRLEYVLPVRGLIGYRGQLLTETRGTALLHQIGEGYGPWAGEVTHRTAGVLVSGPRRHVERLRPVQPPGARGAVHRQRRRGLRGHGRRRELPLRRHGRQPDQGEEAHQHPDPRPRRGAPAHAAAAAHPRGGPRVHRRGRARRGDADVDPAAQAPPAQARAGARARARHRARELEPPRRAEHAESTSRRLHTIARCRRPPTPSPGSPLATESGASISPAGSRSCS